MNPRFNFAVGTLTVFAAFPALAVDDTEAIIVTATRTPTRSNELLSDVSLISRDEIEAAGNSATAAELLGRQPGIEMGRSGSIGSEADIRIRGAAGNQTLLLIDGVRIGSATTGAATWSRIPLSEIDHIEILRGPSSSLYGNDAMGGVIQMFTRRGNGSPRFFAEGGVGSQKMRSGSAGFSGSSNGWRYSLNASTFTTSGFSNVTNAAATNYNPDRDGYESRSASGGLSYELAKGHELGLSFLINEGLNRYDSGNDKTAARSDYESQSDIGSYTVYSKNAFTSNWTSTLRYGYSDDDSTALKDSAMISVFRTEQKQIGWQNDVKLPIGKALLALERLDQTVGGTSRFATDQRTINSYLVGWSGYSGMHRLQINARHDDNSQFGAKNTGNAAYGLQLDDNWRWHVSYGTAYKAPTFNDLYYPLTGGYHGNPNLVPETARNAETAVYFERGDHRASATYYVNKISNLISWSGKEPANIGNATLEGLTLSYEGRIADLDIAASYDWLDARDDATGKTLARRARQRATLSVGKSFGAWDAHAEIAATGRRYDTDYYPTAPTRDVMGGYTLLNLHGSYRLHRDWSLFARADNVFNKKYEHAFDYAAPGASVFVGLRFNHTL